MEKNSRPPAKTGGCCVGTAETKQGFEKLL